MDAPLTSCSSFVKAPLTSCAALSRTRRLVGARRLGAQGDNLDSERQRARFVAEKGGQAFAEVLGDCRELLGSLLDHGGDVALAQEETYAVVARHRHIVR